MLYLFSILDKIFFIILLMGVGVLAKRMRWISEAGEKDLGGLMMNLIWPCLIFSSIVTRLNAADIEANIWLPILSIVMHVVGYGLGLIVCSFAKYQGDKKKMFLFHATINNFLNMALPFATYFFPNKGAALLSVANLGSTLTIWILGLFILTGDASLKQTLKILVSPCLIAIILAILCVLAESGKYIPGLVMDALQMVGNATLFVGLMLAGTQIYKLGWRALRLDRWNLLVGLLRNIVVPALMLGLSILLLGRINREGLTVFMLVSMAPVSVNSITLAMKYGGSTRLAAEGVIFTHLLGIPTMLAFVALTEYYILRAPG